MRSPRLARVTASAARHTIATTILVPAITPAAQLGEIALEPHQVDAIARLRGAIAEFGGALLCDPVGTGKTYTALALASGQERVLVVGPAVIRPMWRTACELARVPAAFVSHESLSRGLPLHNGFDFVIVDEAHHVRNAATRRFRALAELVSGHEMVLLTATPIHNKLQDLRTLLSLFLGTRASTLNTAELGRCIVRREHAVAVGSRKPAVIPLRWYDVPHDDRIAKAILDLPPPLPSRDGGDGGALIAHSLIRQWASSDAALKGGLFRRAQRATALIDALESGTYPTKNELQSWSIGTDSVQLAFGELLASPIDRPEELLTVIRAHRDGVMRVVEMIEKNSTRDDSRAELLRLIRSTHAGTPLVAFSQYADTIAALFRRLVSDGAIAALSGNIGRVAGGSISRDEIIARFAPEASMRRKPSRAEAVTMLLTTDILSEGVNLQDAGVIVHLDLPWTPAAMEQRLGRLTRIGSHHSQIHAYAIHPPASADALGRFHAILTRKAQQASVIVSEFPSLGSLAPVEPERNEPQNIEEVRGRLTSWTMHRAPFRSATSRIEVAAALSSSAGFIAACTKDGSPILLCSEGNGVTADPLVLLRCLRFAEGADATIPEEMMSTAFREIWSHLQGEAALEGIGSDASSMAHANRRVQNRVMRVVTSASNADRAQVATLAGKARERIGLRSGAHTERKLAEMASLDGSNKDWLRFLIESSEPDKPAGAKRPSDAKVIALILFVPHGNAIPLSRAT